MRLKSILGALSLGALALAPSLAQASSHREAPFVSKNPKVDATDFYMFESYDPARPGYVTILANYEPLQDAYGGPNYFELDNNALYEIRIDNTGDGVEDLTFQFQFSHQLGGTGNNGISLLIGPDGGMGPGSQTVAVPFYNVGLIPNSAATPTGNSPNLNLLETYSVNLVAGKTAAPTSTTPVANPGGGNVFTKPADYVGYKSFGGSFNGSGVGNGTADYAAYAANFMYSNVVVPGCTATDANTARVFVGQRAESFAVNLGPTFDLVDAPPGIVTNGGVASGGYAAVPNPIGAKNVTTIALEVPRDCLNPTCTTAAAALTGGCTIGAWTTASVRQARVINPAATYGEPSHEGGAWTQVSRLSNPLVNELVIGLPDKDKWNSSSPTDDAANFGKYVEYPTLSKVIDLIFGTTFEPQTFPRLDLVEAFLQGIPSVNAFPAPSDGGTLPLTEMIRLNMNTEAVVDAILSTTGVTPGAYPAGQSRFGAALCIVNGTLTPTNAGCDPFGFPNGRRPIDDVVDLALDVVEGYLIPNSPAQGVYFTDGVDQAATVFAANWPYLGTPTAGANGNGT